MGAWDVGAQQGARVELGLTGKNVLVSGASRGIGLAIARAFLEEGASVAITARGPEALETARERLTGDFPDARVVAVQADMCQDDDVGRAISQAVADLGTLDCAVANVGSGRGKGGWDVEPDEWARLWELNFASAVLLCQRAARDLPEGGALTLIGSIAGLADLGAPLPYNAAKAALVRYTRDLARRLAPRGVRVNLVAPGNILFPGGRWEDLLRERREEIEVHIEREVPMGRFGTPEEIAAAVVFLCSERASFITGACLVADGGELRS